MNSSQYTAVRPSPRRELQLQGPRPTPLKVCKDSYKIKKPPTAPPNPAAPQQHRPPVIIYTVSPKIIHTSPRGFMSLVQRLTGPTSSYSADAPSPSDGAPSPAARLAAMERAAASTSSPRRTGVEELDRTSGVVDMPSNHHPGILSPVPASLPSIPPNFFSHMSGSSTVGEPMISNLGSFLQDSQSPGFHGSSRSFVDSTFLVNPNSFLSSTSPAVPSPGAYWDLFNQYQQDYF